MTTTVEMIWGTAIGVDVRDPIDPAAVDDVFAWCGRVDALFSTWRDDSDISRIGRGELSVEQAAPELAEVLALCDAISIKSRGAFDITVGADPRVSPRPGLAPLDPSGLVKGWALDRATLLLEAAGATNFTINAGGDVVVRGRPTSATEWRVGIQHPWEKTRVAAVVAASNAGIATSGRYERGNHVIDPVTGRPATGLMSVTVVADTLAEADGYATAAVAMGADGIGWLVSIGASAMAITDDQRVIATDRFAPYRRG